METDNRKEKNGKQQKSCNKYIDFHPYVLNEMQRDEKLTQTFFLLNAEHIKVKRKKEIARRARIYVATRKSVN